MQASAARRSSSRLSLSSRRRRCASRRSMASTTTASRVSRRSSSRSESSCDSELHVEFSFSSSSSSSTSSVRRLRVVSDCCLRSASRSRKLRKLWRMSVLRAERRCFFFFAAELVAELAVELALFCFIASCTASLLSAVRLSLLRSFSTVGGVSGMISDTSSSRRGTSSFFAAGGTSAGSSPTRDIICLTLVGSTMLWFRGSTFWGRAMGTQSLLSSGTERWRLGVTPALASIDGANRVWLWAVRGSSSLPSSESEDTCIPRGVRTTFSGSAPSSLEM
mmetsp:Transcript_24788/g.58921  ORF Transcript_24788/g.58921 Transcript_24788/m.58921 type:complete len:278 (-) Transcript_24788:395-1228(-)